MPPAPPQQGQDSSGLGPMWIVIGIFAVILIVWFIFKVQIIDGFFFIKLQEMRFIGLFTNSISSTEVWVKTVDPFTVTLAQLGKVAEAVGEYFKYPVAVIMVAFGIILFRHSIGSRFNQTYTMKTLLKAENGNWPQTTPVMGLDLIKENINEGPWAMAQTPMIFAKRNKLLRIERAVLEEGMLSHEAKDVAKVVKSKAAQYFIKQVGSIWTDVEHLPMHVKMLLAVCAARIDDDAVGASNLLRSVSASARDKHIDFSGTNELLAKHVNNEYVQGIMKNHAYVLTVMASLLRYARSTGVLAVCDFLWLKPVDRRMWYMMSSVGRQTPFVEVAGAFAHWMVEDKLQRKLVTPMVDEAVIALDYAINMVIYKPGEE